MKLKIDHEEGMAVPPIFERADFFGSNDEELLTWAEPDEYIANLYANGGDYKLTVDQWLDKNCPLKVYGWTRKVNGENAKLLNAHAETALETFSECLIEDYGNPEDEPDFWTTKDANAVIAKLVEAFDLAARTMKVWQCDQTTSREYSRDEVAKILEDYA